MKPGFDYIGVGVGAIIKDNKGKLFLAKRGYEAKNEKGLWEFPGGTVEFGEKLQDALKRELFEEFGIQVTIKDLLDVVDHILPNEGQHWISPTYICEILSGTPKILEPSKCSEIGWFQINEIPNNLTLVSKISLEHYIESITIKT